jgi:hypothetical protein
VAAAGNDAPIMRATSARMRPVVSLRYIVYLHE